jgi:hypothetical protein
MLSPWLYMPSFDHLQLTLELQLMLPYADITQPRPLFLSEGESMTQTTNLEFWTTERHFKKRFDCSDAKT